MCKGPHRGGIPTAWHTRPRGIPGLSLWDAGQMAASALRTDAGPLTPSLLRALPRRASRLP